MCGQNVVYNILVEGAKIQNTEFLPNAVLGQGSTSHRKLRYCHTSQNVPRFIWTGGSE